MNKIADPILTIFTPAYNRAHTMPRTYESLCRQNCKNFIWLIVDDGSTDNTAELVRDWQSRDCGFEIRYICKENGGMHTAHNMAYANIHTELNTCIDSDDVLAVGAVEKILHPEAVEFTLLTGGILLASILVKLYMYLYNRAVGKKIGSAAMEATAMDSLSDCAATAAVLAATLIGHFTSLQIDGWCGIVVAALVLWAGIQAARDTISPLLGQPPAPEFVQRIEEIVLSSPVVQGIHDLIVHDYGPGRVMISLHAEVPAHGDIMALHDEIDNIEQRLRRELGCAATIHMDPIVTDDKLTAETRERVAQLVRGIDEHITIHDFRMVTGPTHTNVIFDAVVPFKFRLSDHEVEQEIQAAVKRLDSSYFAVVQIDRDYTK